MPKFKIVKKDGSGQYTTIAAAIAAAASGESVTIDAELAEIDRKRLVFNVKVSHGETLVSQGTHQRFIVGG